MKGNLYFCALLCASACNTGESSEFEFDNIVVRGAISPQGADPAVVLILPVGCTGTVTTTKGAKRSKIVTTAKHCLERRIDRVVIGNSTNGQSVQVVSSVPHPREDLAVLILAQEAPVDAIPARKTAPQRGESIRLVGFGETDSNRGDGMVKRYGATTLDQVTAGEIVVGSRGSSSCHGDSGGPYFTGAPGQEELVATVSRGTTSPCSVAQSIGVRVDAAFTFISLLENGDNSGGLGNPSGSVPPTNFPDGQVPYCPPEVPYACPQNSMYSGYCTDDSTLQECFGGATTGGQQGGVTGGIPGGGAVGQQGGITGGGGAAAPHPSCSGQAPYLCPAGTGHAGLCINIPEAC